MGAMNKGRAVLGRGLVLAAVAVLIMPASAGAADNPTVRVTRPGAGRIVLDVSDHTVAVRKEITADRSVVTLTTPKERLSITVRRGVLTITGGETTVVVGGTEADGARLLEVVQGSEAAARALTLLERVSEGPETFAGQSLLLTRAVLEMGTGGETALNQHQRWVSERAAAMARPGPAPVKPMLIKAAWLESPQSRTPGECWDLYAAEAYRIAKDFDECTDDLRWYEAHKWAGCSLIYAIRAEGAMLWFISCNGGIPFSG